MHTLYSSRNYIYGVLGLQKKIYELQIKELWMISFENLFFRSVSGQIDYNYHLILNYMPYLHLIQIPFLNMQKLGKYCKI